MKNIYAFFFALISFVEVCGQEPSKAIDQGVSANDFYLKHASWITGEGRQAEKKEVERIKAKIKTPGFIRDELIREYILAREALALREAEVEYISKTTFVAADVEFKIKLIDSSYKAIEECRSKVLKILDILSRMPESNPENQSGRKDR